MKYPALSPWPPASRSRLRVLHRADRRAETEPAQSIGYTTAPPGHYLDDGGVGELVSPPERTTRGARMTRWILAALCAFTTFPADAQNRPPEPPPLPLSWPVTISQDTFLKKFCLYDSRIYSTQSYVCLGTNQALQCIAGDPASWSLNTTASWCR